MIDTAEGKYIIPRVSGTPLIVDLVSVVKAEARLDDVATVNIHTAPELMATFNRCWNDAHDCATALTLERDRAEDDLRATKAEVLLDLVMSEDPKIKRRASSQDLRDASVDADVKVRSAKERVNEIKSVLSHVQGKVKKFENAWRSVRSLVETYRSPPPSPLNSGRIAPEPFGGQDPFETKLPAKASSAPTGMEEIFGDVKYRW